MVNLADILLHLTDRISLNAFRKACADPVGVQAALLQRILRENADTAYGREHHFADIADFTAFRRALPLTDYDHLKPWIDRALHGESGQLTAENPILFAMTSGTTGEPKYIPVTPASRDAKSAVTRIWLNGLHADHPDAFAGKILAVVSPEEETRSPGGIPCGAESGHGYRNVSFFLKPLHSCPYAVFQIADYESRYYTLVRIAAGQDISLIYCCNPSTVVLLCDRLATHAADIIRDIRDGTLRPDLELEPEIRAVVEKDLKPDPARADFLQQVLAGDAGFTPAGIWPQLGAVACWRGGNVSSYLDRFADYFPADTPVRDIGYLASELRGSIPLSDHTDAGPLAIETNVYEFVPFDADAPPDTDDAPPDPASLLGVEDLEVDQQYFVYITTLGGLYRYEMNDIVEVTGFYEKTPMLRFVQKGKGVVSFTGEKLYEQQVIAAVEDALGDRNGYDFIQAVGQLDAADDLAHYHFLIAFDSAPSDADAQTLIGDIDHKLAALNPEYGSKRDSRRIAPPHLHVLAPGTLENYRKAYASNGGNDGQFKTLKLTDDPKLLDALALTEDPGIQADG